MSRFSLSLIVGALGFAGVLIGSACSSTKNGGTSGDGGSVTTGDSGGVSDAGDAGPYALQVPCTDTPDSIYGDPGTLPSANGAIIKCAHYEDITASALYQLLQVTVYYTAGDEDSGVYSPPYAGPTFPSGAHVYRVLYRTERGDPNSSPGYSSALVFVPDTPKAAQSPIIVASHGSRGQAAHCAPSTDDDAGSDTEQDFRNQVYPLVGYGYVVIAPDLAGYANFGATGNPPSAYADVADVGRSTLDGARALKALLGPSLLDKVILTGHSQGGGTALGALTQASTYAPELTIAGVAVYSPLWLSARTNMSFLLQPSNYPLATTPEGAVATWYMYTHGELLDGPGHGLDVFAASAKNDVLSFVNNDCWGGPYAQLDDAGASLNDLIDPTFQSVIVAAASGVPYGSTCATSSNPTLCNTWMSRFEADWPHITGAAQQVPILSIYGTADETITPDLAACVFNRYKTDQVNVSVCMVPTGTHGSTLDIEADYVDRWIASLTLGAAAPAPCQYNQNNLVANEAGVLDPGDDAGTPIPCNSLVPTN